MTISSTFPARHRASCYAFFNRMHIVGDYSNGKVYELSATTYTDDSDAITRQRIFPHAYSEKDRIRLKEFELDCETGVGASNITISWSKDGGHTYSATTFDRSLGAASAYKTRLVVRSLGIARDWLFKISMTGAVKAVIRDAIARPRNEKTK